MMMIMIIIGEVSFGVAFSSATISYHDDIDVLSVEDTIFLEVGWGSLCKNFLLNTNLTMII